MIEGGREAGKDGATDEIAAGAVVSQGVAGVGNYEIWRRRYFWTMNSGVALSR